MSPVSSRMIMRSRPETTSGFRLEAPTNSGNMRAGRRLANSPSSLRMRSMPCSGRCGRGNASYCGPPTAPASTASAARASLSVGSGSGSPCASTPAPPYGASSSSSFSPSRARAFSTLTACATISGPMPSPASTAIFMGSSAEQPGLALAVLRLERLDLVGVLEREPDLVEPVQQGMLGERVDVELEALAARRGHRLRLEVYRDPVTRLPLDLLEEPVDGLRVELDQQQAVLEAVVVEDVREARRDHGLEPVLQQRPGSVLARGPAAEVLAREQHRCAAVARLVQHEVGVERPLRVVHAGLAMVQVTPLVEQVRAVAGALDGLEILFGNDRVGVDVGAVHRRHQ